MKSWTSTGDRWETCAGVPLEDRGFRYGMSIFETVAVTAGRPLLLEPHCERLRRAARDIKASAPEMPPFDFSPLPDGLLRFYLTAGPGGPETPFAGGLYAFFDAAVVGWQLPAARVVSCTATYLARPGGWKSGNYWQNIDALAAARQEGCDEALLFNPAGMLVSASMANVFLHLNGRWITPALSVGTRDGAVRAWVLKKIDAGESRLDRAALAGCTAAFLTNSRMGIRPVAELDGRPLENAAEALQRLYYNEVFCA
jgi:branched-subunit amino acid aminotransferase/4-amino-4-deoxychorismate lyase